MNPNVERMAREAGFYPENGPGMNSVLEAFARLIAEDCASAPDIVNSADISAADKPHTVVEKYRNAIRERYK